MEEFFWVTFSAAFVLLWAVIIVVAKYFSGLRRQRAQEMTHSERLAAIDKGLPLPELVGGSYEGMIPAGEWATTVLPRLSLAIGLLLVFGGAGLCLSFVVMGDRSLQQMWGVGLIPAFAGLGLVLYFVLSRRFV